MPRSTMSRLIRPLLIAVGVSAAPGLTGMRTSQPLAQTPSQTAPSAVATDVRAMSAYLSQLGETRSGCGNAAWSFWQSNDYARWRARRTSMLSMNHSGRYFQVAPMAPARFAADQNRDLKDRLDTVMREANDLQRDSGQTFKELATYINAKDYESDAFRKGDALNATLLAAGRRCHALDKTMTALTAEASDVAIRLARTEAARGEIVDIMIGDWRAARELSALLAEGLGADLAAIDRKVAMLTATIEERRRDTRLDLAGDSALKSFYETVLEANVAVPMRRLMRDAARDTKTLREAAEDRPRSRYQQTRTEIDVRLPGAILDFMRASR